MRALAIVLAGALLAGCSSTDYRSGRRAGERAARADIAAGRPCLLFLGMPAPDRDVLDPGTGLPTASLTCVVGPTTEGHVDGYNATVRDALRRGDLAGMTYADRVLDAAAVRDLLARDGREAVVDTTGALPPGVEFRVTGPANIAAPWLTLVDAERGVRTPLTGVGSDRIRVAVTHGGRTLVVHDPGYGWTRTFDLRRGQELQTFSDGR